MDEYTLKDVLAEETEASEASREDVPETKGERRNRSANRSVVFSVRLNPDEVEALQALAERASLPASTLARSWIVDRIRTEELGGHGVEQAAWSSRDVPPHWAVTVDTPYVSDSESEAVRALVRQELLEVLRDPGVVVERGEEGSSLRGKLPGARGRHKADR